MASGKRRGDKSSSRDNKSSSGRRKIFYFTTYLLFALFVSFSCKSYQNNEIVIRNESEKPFSYFKVYRGNTHSHTLLTWTHGEHRTKGMNDLSQPTEFHPDWNVPANVDWRDCNSIFVDPNGYTNRQGLPDNHFELAIANGYDFYAITDHSQEPNFQPVSVDNKAWKAISKAVEKYKRPGFVPLVGFEYSRNTNENGGNGHMNVLNSSTYINADHGQRGPAPAWPEANWSIPQFYNWVKNTAKPYKNSGYVVVGFNHPSAQQYDDWNNIDAEIAEKICTFEIHTNYNKNRWDAYIRALNKGWRVSPIGVHDNHGYSAILNKQLPPPTFVLAPELTAETITRALHERRTFASWNEGVEVRYSVNGQFMGSILKKPDVFKFHIEIITPDSKENEQVKKIQIVRNNPYGEGVIVAADKSFEGNKSRIVWDKEIKDTSAKYFFLQIFHENDIDDTGNYKSNGSTISAPVWTGR